MKTNQVMKRQMGMFAISQRTSDGFFEANDLIRQWNLSYGKKKSVREYLSLKETKTFSSTIEYREKPFRNNSGTDNQFVTYVEKKGRFTKTGRTKDETWMHPLLFIDFAMWINPEFKYDVLKFVSDQMLQYRNEAGEAYKVLVKAVSTLVGDNNLPKYIPNIAKAINYVVFGEHSSMIRNEYGSEDKQKELWALERKLAELVEDGFITSYDQLIGYLRKKWIDKYQPKILR